MCISFCRLRRQKGKRSFSGTPQYGSNKKKVRKERQEAVQMAQ
jgi:hypothetical protein